MPQHSPSLVDASHCCLRSGWCSAYRPPLLQAAAASHLLSDGLPSTGLSIKTGARAQGLPAAATGMPAPVEVFARFPQVRCWESRAAVRW